MFPSSSWEIQMEIDLAFTGGVRQGYLIQSRNSPPTLSHTVYVYTQYMSRGPFNSSSSTSLSFFPCFFFSPSLYFFHWNGSLLNFWLSIFCQDAFLFWSLGWLKGSWFLSKTAIRKWKVAHNSCSCNSTICKAGVFETFGLWHVNVFHPKNWTQNLWKDENNHRHTNQLNLSSLPSKPYSIPLSLFLSLWLSSVSDFQPSFLSRFLQPLPD